MSEFNLNPKIFNEQYEVKINELERQNEELVEMIIVVAKRQYALSTMVDLDIIDILEKIKQKPIEEIIK